MRKIFFIVSFFVLSMSVGCRSQSTHITLFPPRMAVVETSSEERPQNGQLMIIKKLPLGVDPAFIQVVDPQGSSWFYTPGVFPLKLFLDSMQNKSITVVEDGAEKTAILVGVDEQNRVLVKEGERLRITDIKSIRIPTDLQQTDTPHLAVRFSDSKWNEVPLKLMYKLTSLIGQFRYQVDLNSDYTTLQIRSFLDIKNESGETFKHTQISVQSVDSQEKPEPPRLFALAQKNSEVSEFGEQYRYDLPDHYDIQSAGTTTIPIFSTKELKCSPAFVFDTGAFRFFDRGEGHEAPVELEISWKNETDFPVIPGSVMIFVDKKFYSEGHFPKASKSEISFLSLGTVFDMKGKKILKEVEKVSKDVHRDTYQVTVQNFKSTPATVEIHDRLWGTDWKILKSSQSYEKLSATTIKYSLQIPAKSSQDILYTIEVRD